MDEALAEQQRAAYRVEGVDDEAPAMDPSKKRKAVVEESVSLLVLRTTPRSGFIDWLLGECEEIES